MSIQEKQTGEKMLCPEFELDETDSHLIVTIIAPNADLKNIELTIGNQNFEFLCNPYYLQLKLPGKLEEKGLAAFECVDGDKLVFTVTKAVPGENFQYLDSEGNSNSSYTDYSGEDNKSDLVSNYSGEESTSDVLSDYSGEENRGDLESDYSNEENISFNEEEDDDLQAEGACALPPQAVKPKYGFANCFSNVGFTEDTSELFDLPSPNWTPSTVRSKLKKEKELEDFSLKYYCDDLFKNRVPNIVKDYQPSWQKQNFQAPASLTAKEFDQLEDIEQYDWSSEQRTLVYLGLLDILLAFCYINRVTEGYLPSELAFIINKLSSTLSWFETFKNVKSVLISFVRRSLCYPMIRHWDFSLKVVADVESLLRCDKVYIQKCLLQIRNLFIASEPRSILNTLYIDNYCHWIEYARDTELIRIANLISKIQLSKDDVELNLVALEETAQLELELTDEAAAALVPTNPSASNMDELTACIKKMAISQEQNNDKPRKDCLESCYPSTSGFIKETTKGPEDSLEEDEWESLESGETATPPGSETECGSNIESDSMKSE